MKPGPAADYPVKVIHEPAEHEPPEAELYTGIFSVTLNYVVDLVFVPDVGSLAPPWDDHLLAGLTELTTPEQARLVAAIPWPYVVTPNATLAGADERFEWGHDSDRGPFRGVVFYLTPDEFARYSADLARLAELSEYSLHAKETVSVLRDYGVIGFIERRILASRWLEPRHAAMLCRAQANVDGVAR